MIEKDSDDNFTFSIEGKDYTISEKSTVDKNNQKRTLHAPSLTIGAIITAICITGVIFGIEGITEPSEELIEKQLIDDPERSTQITIGTLLDNGSTMLGNSNAPITLIEFGDYQCHFCNVYYQNTEHKIFKEYVMTGKINVIFKDYTIIGPDSTIAALGAHCAGEQGKFWEYHNTLYENWNGENNGWAGQENIFRFAEQIELNMEEFIECNIDKRYEQKISKSSNDARTLGVTGTPAFYVISANSQQVEFISGAQPYEVFEKIFNSMLET